MSANYGGTEILEPLKSESNWNFEPLMALEIFSDELKTDKKRDVLLFTDGSVTVDSFIAFFCKNLESFSVLNLSKLQIQAKLLICASDRGTRIEFSVWEWVVVAPLL